MSKNIGPSIYKQALLQVNNICSTALSPQWEFPYWEQTHPHTNEQCGINLSWGTLITFWYIFGVCRKFQRKDVWTHDNGVSEVIFARVWIDMNFMIILTLSYLVNEYLHHDIDSLVQRRCNSSALARKLCLFCTEPSICFMTLNWYPETGKWLPFC